MATASSKAITFSLIMFMVRVSLFCCCLGVRAIGGERGEDCPDRSIIYKASRNIQSPIRLKIIHHRNRKRQSPGRWRGEAAGCGAIWGMSGLRRGHLLRGGGRWPRLVRCMSGAGPDGDRAGGPSRGGALAAPAGQAGRQRVRVRMPHPGDGSTWKNAGLERGARQRIARSAKWCCAGPNSNAKTPRLVARLAIVCVST